MEERLQILRVAANISNKQSRTADRGGLPAWGWGEVLTTYHSKKTGFVTKREHLPWTCIDTLVRPKQWERDKRFGTWNVRSLYRAG
jgi:hypothetical protein